MNSRERVRNTIEHRPVDHIAAQFNSPYPTDFTGIGGWGPKSRIEAEPQYFNWGRHQKLLDEAGGFSGDVRYDNFGNIYGRLNGLTKGECIKGALTTWDDFENFKFPEVNYSCFSEEQIARNKASQKYVLIPTPFTVFSLLRDLRLMPNALMDVVLEEENVEKFMNMLTEENLKIIDKIKDYGVDGFLCCDDWGTQDRTFISPDCFRRLFKPAYKAIGDRLHKYNMHLFLHSCGYNYAFMEDFIDAGIDVLQFDQLGAYGYKRMADEFAGRVTFWSPLDIQKTLPTGNRELIESEAEKMITAFEGKGSLILKDYPSYQDIEVKDEWAGWARDVFFKHSNVVLEGGYKTRNW